MEGVEPPRLSALGSKPSVSTSSTTSPERERIILQNQEMLRSFIESLKVRNMESHFFFFYEPLIRLMLRKSRQEIHQAQKN